MNLVATACFSGVLGSAGIGNTLEVDEKTGKEMLEQGYPVKEVQDEAKRDAGEHDTESPAPTS